MAYTAPQFNLLMAMWVCVFPDDGPPNYTSFPCQLYWNSRQFHLVNNAGGTYFGDVFMPIQWVRFPRQSPFDTNQWQDWSISCVEIPEGTGVFYRVGWGAIAHQGFPNEYNALMVQYCNSAGQGLVAPASSIKNDTADDPCI